MVSEKIIVDIPAGLHLRPISVLCNHAIDYQSNITINSGTKSVNAKSLIGVLSACVRRGDEIELVCEGPDEVQALTVLSNLIKSGLGDEFRKK